MGDKGYGSIPGTHFEGITFLIGALLNGRSNQQISFHPIFIG
jgi:hypothetical protein